MSKTYAKRSTFGGHMPAYRHQHEVRMMKKKGLVKGIKVTAAEKNRTALMVVSGIVVASYLLFRSAIYFSQ